MIKYTLIDLASIAVFALPPAWLLMALCKNKSAKKYFWISIFMVYLCGLADVVGLPSLSHLIWEPTVNFVPFSSERDARYFLQLGLNALLFVPLGFLLPILWRRYRSWKRIALIGFLISLSIEILQLFSFRFTDVDDLILNTFGAFIGYGVAWCCFHKSWDRACPSGAGRVRDLPELLLLLAIPLLVVFFLRAPFTEWLYSLPLFASPVLPG